MSDQQHKLFQALSKYTGRPMSSLISEILETTAPVLERTATVFQRLHEQQSREKDRIKLELEQAQNALEPIASQALDQFDLFLAKFTPQQADDPPRANAESVPHGESFAMRDAPPTNRGDTPPLVKTQKPATGKPSKPIKTEKILKKNRGLNS